MSKKKYYHVWFMNDETSHTSNLDDVIYGYREAVKVAKEYVGDTKGVTCYIEEAYYGCCSNRG